METMSKAIKQHLESITAENLDDFQHEAFISTVIHNNQGMEL